MFKLCIYNVKWKWHVAKYGYPYSEFVLCINPSKVHTHSSEHTHREHTHREHTPGAVGSHVTAPGEQLGVRCLAQGHLSRGIEGGERALYIHSPTNNPCSQPFDYESDSLTQGSSNLILEGRCPVEFSSNLPQHTCLEVSSIPSKTLINCFRCVWLELELNSAGHRPSRTELGDPCSNH